MQVYVAERGPRSRCSVKLGESTLEVERCTVDELGAAHCVIRPERVRIEPFGSAGANRVPAMVERLVYVGSATQVMLPLAPGGLLQAGVPNDRTPSELSPGPPLHAFPAPAAPRRPAPPRPPPAS